MQRIRRNFVVKYLISFTLNFYLISFSIPFQSLKSHSIKLNRFKKMDIAGKSLLCQTVKIQIGTNCFFHQIILLVYISKISFTGIGFDQILCLSHLNGRKADSFQVIGMFFKNRLQSSFRSFHCLLWSSRIHTGQAIIKIPFQIQASVIFTYNPEFKIRSQPFSFCSSDDIIIRIC